MHTATRYSPKTWTCVATENGIYVQQNYSFLVFEFCQFKTKFKFCITNGGNMSLFAMNILNFEQRLIWYGKNHMALHR